MLPTEIGCSPDALEIAYYHSSQKDPLYAAAFQNSNVRWHFASKQTRGNLHIHAAFIRSAKKKTPQVPLSEVYSPLDLLESQNGEHNALNRMGYKGDGLKIRGNNLATIEAVTITGSSRCLMPNGPLRARLTGQLTTETRLTLCQFTIILVFVMQRSTDTPLFADLWIIQLEQNAMTHFWSKSHYQGEEALFPDMACSSPPRIKSSPPQRNVWMTDQDEHK